LADQDERLDEPTDAEDRNANVDKYVSRLNERLEKLCIEGLGQEKDGGRTGKDQTKLEEPAVVHGAILLSPSADRRETFSAGPYSGFNPGNDAKVQSGREYTAQR
jgi:hypothetical protein